MLNLDMLALLARPEGAGPRPPLESVFAQVVADGWAPRNPCTDERELARLEQRTVRGDCISPLLQAGDTIFVDPSMPAQSGDVVLFALSSRGAAAQNSDLPPGQTLWAPGDRWCKLYIEHRGFQMLLDRHGSSATASLLACERPDDTPILMPVRNVRRAGCLLFTSDVYATQLGVNAATLPASSTYTTATTMLSSYITYVSVTVVIPDGESTGQVLVTGNANVALGSSPSGDFRLTLDGTAVQSPLGWNANMANQNYTSAFDYTDTLDEGTHTFEIQGINTSGGATFENAALTVSNLKR